MLGKDREDTYVDYVETGMLKSGRSLCALLTVVRLYDNAPELLSCA